MLWRHILLCGMPCISWFEPVSHELWGLEKVYHPSRNALCDAHALGHHTVPETVSARAQIRLIMMASRMGTTTYALGLTSDVRNSVSLLFLFLLLCFFCTKKKLYCSFLFLFCSFCCSFPLLLLLRWPHYCSCLCFFYCSFFSLLLFFLTKIWEIWWYIDNNKYHVEDIMLAWFQYQAIMPRFFQKMKLGWYYYKHHQCICRCIWFRLIIK